MKHLLQIIAVAGCTVFSMQMSAQPTVCPINAGPDQTICSPNCATITGTYVQTHATTGYTVANIPYAPDPYTVGTSVFVSDDQ